MKYINAEIPYYTFENIDQTGIARTAFTGKLPNGIKLYWRDGEDIDEITRNNDAFLAQFGSSTEKLITINQKHTSNVHVAGEEDLGCSLLRNKILETDGAVSNISGSVLVVDVADCTPVFFADPVKKAIGIAHAGRKGTQLHICRKVIDAMSKEYGSDPEEIIVGIGPSICLDCYEVGDDVAEDFWSDWSRGMKAPVQEAVMKSYGEKYHLDLWEANRLSMIEAGVKPENIQVSEICTKCKVKDFYSFRGDGGIINENAAYIILK